MHVRYDLLRVQQYDQVLRKERQSIDYKIFLSEPDRTCLCNSELRTKYSNINVGEFVRILNLVDVARASDLGNRRTNHFRVRMQCA